MEKEVLKKLWIKEDVSIFGPRHILQVKAEMEILIYLLHIPLPKLRKLLPPLFCKDDIRMKTRGICECWFC